MIKTHDTRGIGIIGYGRFGRLAAHYLKEQASVCVFDTRRNLHVERGVSRVSLNDVLQNRVVVLAVPINAMPSLLQTIAPLVRRDATVVDIASVKEKPVQWMTRNLPQSVNIIGTHPLFGPDSASKTLKGRKVVLCPVRAPRIMVSTLIHRLKSAGLDVVEMTPAEHDKLMASTLFLTQLVGHSLGRLLPKTTMTTQNFELLQHIVRTTGNDTKELFRDMYEYNRFAKQIPKQIIRSFENQLKGLR